MTLVESDATIPRNHSRYGRPRKMSKRVIIEWARSYAIHSTSPEVQREVLRCFVGLLLGLVVGEGEP